MADPGWPWPDPAAPAGGDGPPDLARAAARLLDSADGRRLLAHLRRLTLERALGPEAPEPVLRHLEGQRALVLSLEALAARGRSP
ncbi:hypothetical protein [Oleisolibacter albus]|uniref:Bbp19 family protein n=1 Tax=Oleisolibacter albus TaxID=2171757 RepID=UPI000DF1C41D|nr:hypothetical protein [Oleisolibacter albus]